MKRKTFDIIARFSSIFLEFAIPCSLLGLGFIVTCIFSFSLQRLIGGIILLSIGLLSFGLMYYISRGNGELARFLQQQRILEKHFEKQN